MNLLRALVRVALSDHWGKPSMFLCALVIGVWLVLHTHTVTAQTEGCPFMPRQPCNEKGWAKVEADWNRVQRIPTQNLVLRKGATACTSQQAAWDAYRFLQKDDMTAYLNIRGCMNVAYAISVRFSRESSAIISDIFVPSTKQYFVVLTMDLLDLANVPASDFKH
jgi:hypothetical protein